MRSLYPVLIRLVFCLVFLAGAFPGLSHSAEKSEPPLAERVAGMRFSATLPFSTRVSQEEASLVAETAATDAAMQYLMRLLVTLPEVRIAGGNASSPVKAPNLLALAHASAETEVLLVSRSKKNSTVTVTVTFKQPALGNSMETRVRETLIHADRLGLYEETVLREKELCRLYETALGESRGGKKTPPGAIVDELKALRTFKLMLPQWNGVWKNPAEAQSTLKNALRLAPDSPLLHNAVGDASLQLGRSQEAVEEQTLAIKAMPSFARAYHSRGVARLALGLLSSSVADFSEAIRLSPLTAAYHRDRGVARHLLGETAPMCADLYEACTLGDCEKLHWAVENAFCSPASFK